MREEFVELSGIPTQVITWGKWIEDSLHDTEELVIFLPGSPSILGYYRKFLHNLYVNLKGTLSIWTLGHAGHSEPPSKSPVKPLRLKGNEKRFDLNGQYRHIVDFFEKYVPNHVNIHLIGHSIACRHILEILKHQKNIKIQIVKCYLLCPGIDRLASTKNYWLVYVTLMTALRLFGWVLYIFYALPYSIKSIVVGIVLWVFSIPQDNVADTVEFIRPSIIEKLMLLAQEEMYHVRDLDIEHIKENKNLLTIFYGSADGWTPLKFYHELMAKVPGLDARWSLTDICHNFMINDYAFMSYIVGDMIVSNSKSI